MAQGFGTGSGFVQIGLWQNDGHFFAAVATDDVGLANIFPQQLSH